MLHTLRTFKGNERATIFKQTIEDASIFKDIKVWDNFQTEKIEDASIFKQIIKYGTIFKQTVEDASIF